MYLSPVRWADFAQRPHKFVEWHHARHGGRVLWVEPYPSRLPGPSDLHRLSAPATMPGQPVPHWLEVVAVRALPIEPLPGGTALNGLLWRDVLRRIEGFAATGSCELVIGKPSRLALQVLRATGFSRMVYDAMDDFPAFHRGLSAHAMAAVERCIAREVDVVQASSSRLQAKFAALGAARVLLVGNACDPRSLLKVSELRGQRDSTLVGYVGTLAGWFDWDMVRTLARGRSDLRFLLVGPLHGVRPARLPANIELRPACSHADAMRQMARFGVGLIPFERNTLTAAVDPVKYYEYRALNVPVVTTAFGEMPRHAREDRGVFVLPSRDGAGGTLEQALAAPTEVEGLEAFRAANSWEARFDAAQDASA
ncbi:MAG: hypothetical protein JWQ88_1578 [Rhodoferax sp.]|nr:hypothetical protein [Rhodoferax sp.]